MNYANRVVLHSAGLRRIGTARLRFFDRVAADPATDGSWSGGSLDRVMADADTQGMALIQATTPVVVGAAMTVAGCLASALAGYPDVALVLAVAASVTAALAVSAARRADDGSSARGSLRTELVTAVGAWPEMASLGAADHLAQRTLGRLAAFEGRRTRQETMTARTLGTARGVTAVAVVLAVGIGGTGGGSVPTMVFLALLAAGVMRNAEQLVPAVAARTLARQATDRLTSSDATGTRSSDQPPTLQLTYDRGALTVSGYRLPETPIRRARDIEFAVRAGETLVLTGASGSGKTTLLDAVATALQEWAADGPAVITSVLAEDYLFTGTVAGNIRLANPTATEDDIQDLLTATALDRSGLEPVTPVGVGGRDLSGGEQRRLHIARALATNPDVLLIDEPTAGLDLATATQVLTAVRRRLPRSVIVMAMHEPPGRPQLVGSPTSRLELD